MTATGRPRGGIVDMNRQEAAIIVMRVEQRELLMTMRDIASIVDIECDGLRGRGVTGATAASLRVRTGARPAQATPRQHLT
jgi:hypothetical protein